MQFKHAFKSRIFTIRDAIWQGWWRRIVMICYILVALYDIICSQLVSSGSLPPIKSLLPNLGWHWLTIGLGLLLIVTWEGLYRLRENRVKDNWILDYELREGKLPPMPNFLLPIAQNYTPGKPISKDIDVAPIGGQYWNSLLPVRRRDLCILLEWLGKDPNDYLTQLRQQAPKISLDLGGGNEEGWK